jgi:peroxiredoxin
MSIDDPDSTSLRSGILLGNQGKSLSLTAFKIGMLVSSEHDNSLDIVRPTAAPNPGQLDWIQWSDGSFAWGTLQEIKEGKISFVVNATEQTVECTLDSIRLFKPKSAGQVQQPISTYDMQFGENRLSGRLELLPDKREVLWRSGNLSTDATVDHRLQVNFYIHTRNSVSPLPTSGFPNVLYLENGDMLPCKLQRATGTAAWLQTPFSAETAQAANDHLRAIELASFTKDRPSFTNESREMLISIPRNLESDTYTHALIGKNSDLLRGNVVSINDQSIEIDSKFEPMVLDRDPVAAIVFLRTQADASETSDSQDNAEQHDLGQLVHIEMLGGYTLSGRWVGGTPETIHLQSRALGLCQIQLNHVIGLEFNQRQSPTVEGYFAWNTKTSMAPRWKAPEEFASKAASELIGSQAPEFALADIEGGTFRLSQQAGKIVVLDFWASWCGPCVASLPKYIELLEEFPDTEVVFYGVNSSETPEVVREFVAKKNWTNFKTLFDYEGSAAQALRVQGIPHTVVIGQDGKIGHVQVGYTAGATDQLRQIIKGLLK